jgi:RNAse (barnase) inhibitor barstar
LLDLGGHSGGPMNVQKPTALDNKLTVPMRPTQAAVTTERPFQQQMQQALSSVDNFGKDVDSVLDGLHSSVNLQAEVRQARSMYERAMEVQQSLQKLYRHLRSAESV